MPINVRKSQIKIVGNEAVVSSPELATALIQGNKSALDLLGVKASDITVSPTGKLIISDATFAKKVKDLRSLADNGACGAGC